MQRLSALTLLALVLFFAGRPAAAQIFRPKSIQFAGADEYSQQQLLAASGLKQNAALTAAQMNDTSKILMDSGVFATLTYKFDGQDLIFQLKPAQLYPIRLENLPFTSEKDLEIKLRDRFPLYDGKVPTEGGLLENVRASLEEFLAVEGIKATVTAALYTDAKQHKVTAISFSITAPPVIVGDIHPDTAAAPLDPKALEIVAKVSGSPYDREGSPGLIMTSLGDLYRDRGYLEAEIRADQQTPAIVTSEAIRVSFSVSISPGSLYKLTAFQLVPGMIVTQADFDKQSHIHPGDIADTEHIRENLHFLERQYHDHGYINAHIQPAASFDRSKSAVSYTVAADPGPVYRMGALSVENVSDDLRTAILAAWKMPAGAIFNEGAIRGFFATHNVNPKLERIFAVINCKYVLHVNDASRTVDVVLRLEKKS